ncbi:MAG: diguanylate cyclase [Bryobacteraceae bacterium]
MISIKRYMRADGKADDTLPRLVRLLIEGVERNCVEGAPDELARFQVSTQPVLAAIESAAPPDELLGHAARAMDALKQYNRHAAEYLRRPAAELQAKVKLLTAAITAISSSSSENIQRLQQIKGQLLSSLDPRDIRAMRLRLSQCLDSVLAEAERQRAEADSAAEQLNRRVSTSPGGSEEVDPATGLPTRDRAEEVIAQACQDEVPAFIAVMVINQIQTMIGTFGQEFGDLILQRFAAFVRQKLPAVDQLFRWSGPTVVALVRRRSVLDARGTIEALLVQRLTIRTGTPDVQIPISSRWTVVPLTASPRLLFQKMDSFANFE